ncbi:MAG: protein kinase domain-containing protein [Ktedonobacteraceae bacterium]
MAKQGSLSGQQVANKYRLGELLGSGGMGAVYKAQDTRLNRPVAMKVMSPVGPVSAADLHQFTQLFQAEALRLASLKHSGIPHIYDHFEEAAHWFLVMEFIEGETLKDYLQRRGGRLSVDEVLKIGLQLVGVLNYLHLRQPPIIFRDLKPANVMIAPDGQVSLIDFGIARLFTPGKSQDTFVFLSPGYAAPEQHGTAQTTVQSDIYSLGATLHHLLSGTHPATSPFLFAPLSIQQPAQLASLIAHMVAFDSTNRPVSMAAVKDALQRMIDQTALPPTENVLSSPSASTLPSTVGAQPFLPVLESPAKKPIMPATIFTQLANEEAVAAGLAVPFRRPDNKVSIDESQDESLETHNVRDAFLGLFLYALSALAESPSGLIRYILGTWFFGLFSLGHMIVGVFSIAQLFGLLLAFFPLLWSFAAFVFPSGGGSLIRHEKETDSTRNNIQQEVEAAYNQLIRPGVKHPRKWYVNGEVALRPTNALGTTLYISQLSMKYPLTPTLAHELGHFNSLDSRLAMARRRLILLNPLALLDWVDDIPGPLVLEIIIGLFWIVFWIVFVGGIGFVLTSGLWSNYLKRRDFAADRYAAKLGQASALIAVLESTIRDEYTPASLELGSAVSEKAEILKEGARKYLAERIDRLKAYK